MILYFSATGNCEHVAKRISEATNDTALSIEKAADSIDLKDGEPLGIITPTYAWGLPLVTEEYLKKLSVNGKPAYVWFLATYGTSPGQSGLFASGIMEKKGLTFDVYFSVKMPDTWTPTFDLSDPDKVSEINQKAEKQIDDVIARIRTRVTGNFMKNKAPVLAAKVFYRVTYDKMRETQHLRVSDACIGCGLCARNCPVRAIEMQGNKPVWVKDHCAMCLRCLHHCPKFAIQYDDRTEKHGQYVWPGKKVLEVNKP